MIRKATEDLLADWLAAQNIFSFQEKLNMKTEDGEYKILAQLLNKEFSRFKPGRLL